MKALVLSGGSIKGAFQSGAISVLFNQGFKPDYIWGVSIGALNGAFLADRAGRAAANNQQPDWPKIGQELKNFWLKNVTKPAAVVKKRPNTSIAWQALLGKFDGFVDTRPVHKLVRRTISYENLSRCPIKFCAGVVNLADGEYFNADARYPDFIDYIIASTAIPIAMPLQFVKNLPMADGGVRDIAPLRHAIAAGAQEIVVIACQAQKLEATSFRPRNLFSLMERVLDVLLDEILQNDLRVARRINLFTPRNGTPAPEGSFVGKKNLNLTVIRPYANPDIDLLKFKKEEIAELIRLGEITAEAELK